MGEVFLPFLIVLKKSAAALVQFNISMTYPGGVIDVGFWLSLCVQRSIEFEENSFFTGDESIPFNVIDSYPLGTRFEGEWDEVSDRQ